MRLDYANNQIVITEESKEHFINVHSHTKFKFCERIRDGKFEVPFVAFPILKDAIARTGYPISMTDALKHHLSKMAKKRSALLRLRNSLEGIEHPQINLLVSEAQVLATKYGFTFTQEQLETVVYGIIGKTVLIGNEIGTGKTLSVNAILKVAVKLGYVKKGIAIVPASLVKNFYDDYVKFFGPEGVIVVRKETKEKRLDLYRTFHQNPKLYLMITNYEKCNFDFDFLKQLKIDFVCVDEFHNMRNFDSAKRSINFFKLLNEFWLPKFRLPMTGTPIENGLFDLFSTFKVLDDGHVLGGRRFFDNNFVVYEPQYVKINGRLRLTENKAIGFQNHVLLKDIIRPYIIRKPLRLPVGLYINHIPLELPPTYKTKIKKIIEDVKGGSARYHAIRQFLNVVEREGLTENVKHQEVLNICNQTSEKVLIFSFYKCSLPSLQKFLLDNGHKSITFSGDDTDKDVTEVIAEFEKSDAKCLIVTDRVNYGANIQFARIVIQYDLPMKPTIFFQRSGRCYRTGQTKDVHVYSMYFEGSVEEKIKENLDRKEHILREIFFNLDVPDKEDIMLDCEREDELFEKKIYEMMEKLT